MQDRLPSILHAQGSSGLSSASWAVERKVRAGDEGDEKLTLSLRLGGLVLEGRGERIGFRCTTFSGTVLEGDDDPCVVGCFMMRLSLPIKTSVSGLEERYQQRIDSRRPPPPTFALSSFVGRWRLLLSVDDDCSPAYFAVELSADSSWQSVGTPQRLAGTWGMLSRDPHSRSGWSTIQPAGSSVWLKVHHARCTETLSGVADLPDVRSDFHLEGQPVLETVAAKLAARAADGTGGVGGAPGAVAERIYGRLWVGSVERAYFGWFTLVLGWTEEDAKRAWLARNGGGDDPAPPTSHVERRQHGWPD